MEEGAIERSVVLGGGPPGASAPDAGAAATLEGRAGVARAESRPEAEPYRPWVVRVLARHPGALLTGLYLALTSVGVLYDFFYFIRFRVNVLDYAQTGDFVVAAIREPLAIFFAVLPAPLIWLAAVLRRWARRVSPRYDAYAARYERKWRVTSLWWDVMITSLFVLYALTFTIEYANAEARAARAGARRQVRVQLLSDAGGPLAAGRTATLIGTTSAYLFLYDRAADSTYVVPVDNVAQVAVSSARAPRVGLLERVRRAAAGGTR